MQSAILLPPDLSKDEIAELKALNAGVAFIVQVPQSPESAAQAVAPDGSVSASSVLPWLDILEALLPVAASIVVPIAWVPIVAGIIKVGIPAARQAITKAPITERWTVEKLLAAQSAVAVPLT